MAKKSVMKNNVGQGTGQRETRPVWNNVQRINHQNKFIPSAVLTRFGRVPVSAAKQSSLRAIASTSTVRPVNTATHTNINAVRLNGVNTAGQAAVSAIEGNGVTDVKASAGCSNPQQALKNKGIFGSGCSRHMIGNKDFLTDYQDIDGGFVAFGGSTRGGKITGKGKIRTGKLDFEDVFFVKKLKFNLFSVSQMCDKKNNVLFTETECFVLSPNFKLLDESQVLLRVPRQSNMYSFDLKNVVPSGDLTCLFAKATLDESNLWHRRMGHVKFKTMNKLVKGNLVRGLPSNIFENDHTCVACQKGKQQKASCKAKLVSSISQPLQMLHMDLFSPTSIRSINRKTYYLVVTDDFSMFSWVFFLSTKDETSGILKIFITEIENQLNHKVKVIRTLIEAARTMIADSLIPTVFWAEVVNTACYVLNRVLVTKPHNKTPYELIIGRPPSINFMRPFGCPVTILNTLDPLGKFDGNAEEGFYYKSSDEKDEDVTADDAAGEKPVPKPASENEQALKNVLDKMMDQEKEAIEQSDAVRKEFEAQCNRQLLQGKATRASSTNNFNTVSTPVNAASVSRTFGDAGSSFVPLGGSSLIDITNLPHDPLMSDLEDTAEIQNTGIWQCL
ncbi:putative ribonuclease H-like domain-containing protein [Tanacetum coccineum]